MKYSTNNGPTMSPSEAWSGTMFASITTMVSFVQLRRTYQAFLFFSKVSQQHGSISWMTWYRCTITIRLERTDGLDKNGSTFNSSFYLYQLAHWEFALPSCTHKNNMCHPDHLWHEGRKEMCCGVSLIRTTCAEEAEHFGDEAVEVSALPHLNQLVTRQHIFLRHCVA